MTPNVVVHGAAHALLLSTSILLSTFRLTFEGFLGELVDETLVIKLFDFDLASFDDSLGDAPIANL